MLKVSFGFMLGVLATIGLALVDLEVRPLAPSFPPPGTIYYVISGTDQGYVLKFECTRDQFARWYNASCPGY